MVAGSYLVPHVMRVDSESLLDLARSQRVTRYIPWLICGWLMVRATDTFAIDWVVYRGCLFVELVQHIARDAC